MKFIAGEIVQRRRALQAHERRRSCLQHGSRGALSAHEKRTRGTGRSLRVIFFLDSCSRAYLLFRAPVNGSRPHGFCATRLRRTIVYHLRTPHLRAGHTASVLPLHHPALRLFMTHRKNMRMMMCWRLFITHLRPSNVGMRKRNVRILTSERGV